MPHTRDTIFADMLSLLKDLQWAGTEPYGDDSCCPVCHRTPNHENAHDTDCHLQATIALAEEYVRIVGERD
jgi:hypothetical protein